MFSTQEFIRQYQNLANPDKSISNQANQYILRLQESNDSFKIAKELLDQPNISHEYLFIACQLIYRRLKEASDITIQPYLLSLLQRELPEVARNQVCSSFAVLIVGNRELWKGVLQDLIQLMKVKINIGIEILSQIAIQGKEWYKKSEQMRLQQEFANQEDKLSEIFLSLLQIQDLSVINQSIYCIECWVQFSYNIYKQQLLIQQLLLLAQQAIKSNQTDFSDKIFNLLNEGVIFSQFNRVQTLEQPIIQNLASILEFLIQIYYPQLTKAQAGFTTKFISDFYAVVRIANQELQAITVMTNIVSNPSRKVAFQTFDFWSYLSEHNQLKGFGLNLLQTMIDKCRMKTIKLTKEFLQGDPEEEDADYNVKYYEGGNHYMSTSDFREHSKDIFYTIYKSAEQAGQSDQYFQIVLQNLILQSSDAHDQIIQCESALYSLCSIIDEADVPINNHIIMQIIQFILNLPNHQNFDIIVKTSLQMFTEFTTSINLNVEVLLQIARYFFKFMLHPLLGPLAGAAFEQICNLSALNDQQLAIDSLIFLETHFIQFVSQSQLNNYIEGLIKLCTRLYTVGNIDSLIKLLEFANNQFKQITNNISEKQFNYCNAVVIAILSWINLNIEDAHKDILQLSNILCSSIIEPLLSLLQNQNQNLNFDELFKLFKIIIKVINYQNQQQQILQILEFSLQVFRSDPIQKVYWLSLITNAISRVCEYQYFLQWALGNGQQIHLFCIEQFNHWRDPDLMKIYVEYVKECIRFCPQVLFESPHLDAIINSICDSYCTLISYEMQREILHFYKTLIQHLDNTKEYFTRIVLKVGQILFLTISEINPALIFQIETIIQFILQKQVRKEDLIELIYQSLRQGWGREKEEQKVRLISQAIVILISRTEIGALNRELKLLLQNLRPQGESEINYMQLEMIVKRK